MGGRSWALAMGLAVAAGLAAAGEAWLRRAEHGKVVIVADPPGIKYGLPADRPDDRRGWSPEVDPPPPDGGMRVLAVGDSVTYGVGVNPREAWPARLEDALRRVYGRGSLTVFNLGVVGWDAEQVATLVETEAARWHPDAVVWGSYANDLAPTMVVQVGNGNLVYVGTSVPGPARLLPPRLAGFLLRHSAAFRVVQAGAYTRAARRADLRLASPEFFARQVDRIQAWRDRTGIPVLVAAIPPHVVATPWRCPDLGPGAAACISGLTWYQQVTEVLGAHALPWTGLLPSMQEAARDGDFFPPGTLDPDHPNARGHRLIAEALLPLVRDALREAAAEQASRRRRDRGDRRHPPRPGAPPESAVPPQ